jgi:heme oxygenase (biliverdin-IX-beta and delta-forming)
MLVDAVAVERTPADTPPTLRDKLKQATASAHRSLDARFTGFDLTNISGYRGFLEANAAALLPLEAALEEAGVASIFPDWPERSRRTAILTDLDCVDGVVQPLGDVAPLGRNAMLGVMYVLEGSRLGAKYLLRAIDASSEPRIVLATSYLSHGAGQRLWPSFLQILEDQSVTLQDEAEIIAGAHLAFALFAEAAARA